MNDSSDIIIVGGGMVGACMALAAAREGFQVTLLEPRQPSLDWTGDDFDIRVSALTRTSETILRNLDVWQGMQQRRVTAYENMHVWDRKGFGEVHFAAEDVGEPNLGHIVENRVIVASLWEQITHQANIKHVADVEIVSIEREGDQTKLIASNDDVLSASIVIGADGARSSVRELVGLTASTRSYDQEGVVCTVKAEQGNASTAWQRFMPTGPLALLPMNEEYFSIVWSTSPEQAQSLVNASEASFNHALIQASEAVCGKLSVVGDRAAFPLRKLKAERYVLDGVALIGDAAHVIHPLAGQGVNLGFLDAAMLMDVLTEARAHRESIGAMGVLRRYERARKGHNLAVQSAMDGFKHLFSNNNPALSLIRNLGLGVAHHVSPLRRQFERVALGEGVAVPSLGKRL
ncbi:MAG: UbiH/UbiF/VisC/COQ6 family ubiquinone biosynthesis hydroxylase [Sedimenticolaceae bacterium]